MGILNPTISGPRLVCSSGASFTVNNPGGSSIVWEPGPGLQRVSSQGSNPCTFSSTGNGNSWIRATLTIPGCGSIPITYTVWAGTPQIAGYTGQVIVDIYTGRPVRELCYGTHNDVEAAHPISYAGVTDWDWQASYGQVFPYGADDEYATVYPNDYQNFMLEVRASNTCGYSDWADIHFEIVDCGSYLLVFAPNPTTGETTLSIESKSKEKTFDETAEWEMEIYSQSQLLVEKKTRQYGQSASIQTAGWKEGVYIVRVLYKGEVLTGRLIVAR